jgi:plasmid segregation protein ParM
MDEITQRIAIDIGYGDTKVMIKDKIFKFASAIEKKKEAQANYQEIIDDVYEFGGKQYTVGDKALSNAISTRGFNFLVKYSPLIVYHAIKLAGLDTTKPIHIITGLSIINWQEKEQFTNALKKINVNNEIIEPKIKLMAQGQGIYHDYKEKLDKGDVCIVDIGYNTFDFLVFTDGNPRQDLSFATKKGSNEIITELQTKIKKRFQFDASEQIAKKIFINKSVEIYGELTDLTDEIEDAKKDYADFIIDELISQRGDLLKTAKKVIFSGGGAYFLDDVKILKNTPNVAFSTKPYEFANVRGYYNG